MSQVEQIKERLNIVDVVSQYIKLQRAGKNYKGLSPFNKEKTPSFYVSTDRGLYHCFSSGKGGDIFTFVQEMEGVDFQGALKILAERAGVELVYEDKGKRDERSRLYDLLEKAKNVYRKNLSLTEVDYLYSRGLNDESIEKWEIGYAKSGWRNLYEMFQKCEQDLFKSGLIKKSEKGSYYDVFRSRIMFPLWDPSGRVVAFSGRIFPDDGESAKYLNSPETELFSKSRILYGYDKAKQSIRKHNFSILVEGQMDVVMSHQAGYTNTIAVSGTALTLDHLSLIQRLSNNVVMAFDADRAGIQSAGKSAMLALQKGMDVKVASLPMGVDPADCIKESADTWKQAVRNAKHIVEFYLNILSTEESDKRTLQLKVHEIVLPFVSAIVNKMDRAHFVSLIASRLGIPEESILHELQKVGTKTVATPLKKSVQHKPSSRRSAISKGLCGVYLWQKSITDAAIDVMKLEKDIMDIVGKELFSKLLENKSIHNKLIFYAEIAYGEADDLQKEVCHLLTDLTQEYLKQELQSLTKQIKEAESKGENTEVLLKKYKELSTKRII